MKLRYFSLLYIFLCFSCSAQKNTHKLKIDNAISIENMPYFPELSGDSTFWVITKDKAILPYLIDRISDTTQTSAPVPYFGGNYTIGDVCVTAIEALIHDLPTVYLITNNEKLIEEKGYGVYWDYVRSSVSNRNDFQKRVRSWYKKNKNNLVWIKDDNFYPAAESENAPMRKLPAGGFYVIGDRKTKP